MPAADLAISLTATVDMPAAPATMPAPSPTAPGPHVTAVLTAASTATALPAAPAVPVSLLDASPAVVALAEKLQGLELDAFFEVSWRELVLRDPEAVVEAGLTDIWGVQEVRLTDISDAYMRDTYRACAVVLDLLQQYDRAALSPDQQISYDTYEWWLHDRLAEQQFMYYDYPATYFPTTAVHETIIRFFTDIHPVADAQDAQDYVTRLNQAGAKLDQLLANLELREEAGIVPPRFATQWALYGTVRGLMGAPDRQTPFYTAFQAKVSALSDLGAAEKEALLEAAEQAIDDIVLPAYSRLADYLQHLEAIGSDHDGVWQFPDGAAYYDHLLHHYTTTDLTADEIHALGLAELERVHAEMRAIFDELGYPQDESLAQLFDRVARDGGHVSGQQVLETYEQIIAAADEKLDVAFDLRPRGKVVVLGDQYGGFYIPGAVDGSRPGAFYAAVGGQGEDYYGMPTLAYHEAIPGHHWQIALAQESDLPPFRQGILFTGYAEGWALYAEQLAWELGWYADDPYGDLGRLQAEAFRAARLVVDTGIHTREWDFDRAQAFFVENVGYEVGDIVNPQHQIARYVVWPGQSTAYKVGMIKILELRQKAMDALGDRFDLKEFHRVVLGNGSVPLEILERLVDDYIAQAGPAPESAAPAGGGVIAFYSDRDGNPEIYTMSADGSGATRLTNEPGFDDSPAISPDGRQIAFLTARHDPKPRFPEFKYEIYVMAVDGSNPRRLTHTEAAEDHPAWSPDSSAILFDADYDGDGYLEIYTMRADGTEVTRLTQNQANDQFGDWSPDGKQIAFASDRNGNWDIYVMDADGSSQQALTDSPDWELFPAWSPDGTQIAYNGLRPRSRNTDVYVMQRDGSDVRQLTDTPRFDENPAWSPDGKWIAFQTERDGNFEIYVMPAPGSGADSSAEEGEPWPPAPHRAEEFWPSWGPVVGP